MKLRLENISVSLSGKTILKNINLDAKEGDFISVLGPSGCGKSTMLKTIAGIIEQKEGNIVIDDKNMNHVPIQKRNAVIVFQDIRLFPHMTVFENIAFPLKMKGVSKIQYEETVLNLMDKVQLNGLENMNAEKISGGQQQRVALARALAAEPKILLLDEPFSSLDENLRFDMRLMIMDIHRQFKMTTIMVTHDKSEALSLSNIVLVMDKGEIIAGGSPKDIYENPSNIEAAKYFGDAAFIDGEIKDGLFKSQEFCIKTDLEDGIYTVMLRSNAIHMVKGNDFKFLYEIYTGKTKEWLFQHLETGLLVRCQYAKGYDLSADDEVSLDVYEDHAVFLKSKV